MRLPSPREMQLLAIVADEELSGRDVAKRFEEESKENISYGTLYTTFRRLKDEGWVNTRDDEDDDGRVRFFRTNGSGAKVLREARLYYASLAKFGLRGATI
jgi:DNA-binding PadR family transcriptional regulator